MAGPLEGFRIIEVTLMSPARFTSSILSMLGAEVITIEMLRGKGNRPARTLMWQRDDDARWLWYQKDKKSVTLNLNSDEGLDIFYRMVKTADAVIDGFRPGVVQRMKVDYETLKKINPGIVYLSATAFGQTGPLKDTFGREPTYQAITSIFDLVGEPGGRPIGVPFPIADNIGALNAAIGLLAALNHKQKTGEGQYVDVSIYDSILPFLSMRIYNRWLYGEMKRGRYANKHDLSMEAWQTKDGRYLTTTFAIDPGERWAKFCRAINREDIIPHHAALNADYDEMPETIDLLISALEEAFLSKTMEEWQDFAKKEDLGIMPILNLDEVLSAPHTIAREMVYETEYEPLGKIKTLGSPYKFSQSKVELKGYPRYGENTVEILKEFVDQSEFEELRKKKVIE